MSIVMAVNVYVIDWYIETGIVTIPKTDNKSKIMSIVIAVNVNVLILKLV
jgi:diketogulonate reductase-like aldo/keto reductase